MALELDYEIRYLVAELNLTSETAQLAEETYQKARELGLARGRSLRVMAAAVTYIAMRLKDEHGSFHDLVKASDHSRGAITKAYNQICRKMELEIPRTLPSSLVPAIAIALGLSDEGTQRAMAMAERGEKETSTGGCSPQGIAAAAIYFAGLSVYKHGPNYRSQEQIAKVARISTVTLRNRLSALECVFALVPTLCDGQKSTD